mgnify:CR=1 FL=1
MLLRKHSGQDFFGYKDSPVLRGIEHRMSQNRIASDEEYVALLKREPEEIDRLQRELLVGVTRFFRDKVAFTDLDGLALSTLIGGSHAQALRFWVVGCSTGEEVYSLAMLAQERIEACRYQPTLKIFATDVQPEALAVARAGLYPFQVSENISEVRLKRFFEPHAHGFKVKPAIRRPIIFSTHNILDDIPFSRIDLVSFRNLLIYLEPDAQREALQRIHYALKPNGFLFVGHSESVESHGDLFRRVDPRAGLYQPLGKSLQTETPKDCFPMSPRRLTLQPAERGVQTSSDLVGAWEESRTRTEELQSVNEELQSANEELQSTNEELETSKEEQQSTNEELETVNSELQNKVSELSRANNDLNNLLASTDIATIFLDTRLSIVRFTPSLTKLFNLLQSDINRPLRDITAKFNSDTIYRDAETVLNTLAQKEQEVQTNDGSCYSVRILPYRTVENMIDGVVITFADVTNLRAVKRLATVVEDSNDAITVCDKEGNITAWNKGAEVMYGYRKSEALKMNISKIVPENKREENLRLMKEIMSGKEIKSFYTQRKTKDKKILDIWLTITKLVNEKGEIDYVSTTERDMSELKSLKESS